MISDKTYLSVWEISFKVWLYNPEISCPTRPGSLHLGRLCHLLVFVFFMSVLVDKELCSSVKASCTWQSWLPYQRVTVISIATFLLVKTCSNKKSHSLLAETKAPLKMVANWKLKVLVAKRWQQLKLKLQKVIIINCPPVRSFATCQYRM